MGWWLALAIAVILVILVAKLRRWTIEPGEVGLLYRDGRFVRELVPGGHWAFDLLGLAKVHKVSRLPQSLMQIPLEVISKDQFAFRMTVVPLVTVIDAKAYHEGTRRPAVAVRGMTGSLPQMHEGFDRLHATLAATVIRAVSSLTLEEFLADPSAAIAPTQVEVAEVLPGTRLDALLVTTVTLPPEVRKMFTEVERARREGLAQLERARGEQAALRALANAARNLADNPQLAQLRMLQTMENAKGAKTFVLGKLPSEELLPG